MTTTRNSIHQPRNFDPTEYDFVTAFDNGCDQNLRAMPNPEQLRLKMEAMALLARSTTSAFRSRGACDHCGAAIRYVAVCIHIPTGDHIAVGSTCIDSRMGCADQADFRFRFIRDAAAVTRAADALADKKAAFLAANPELATLVDYSGSNDFMLSLAEQFNRKGELSERQVAAAVKSLARDALFAARRVAEAETATEAPEGKVTVTGEIIGLKVQEGFYGTTLKMTVRDDRGFKVWISVPAAITNPEKGLRVTFTATLEQSDRDETFAFGKRPTRASVLS